MSKYCYRCGRVHPDMGTAGCPPDLRVPSPVYGDNGITYRQTGLDTIDIDGLKAEIARLKAERDEYREVLEAFDSWWRLPNKDRTIEAIEPAMVLCQQALAWQKGE